MVVKMCKLTCTSSSNKLQQAFKRNHRSFEVCAHLQSYCTCTVCHVLLVLCVSLNMIWQALWCHVNNVGVNAESIYCSTLHSCHAVAFQCVQFKVWTEWIVHIQYFRTIIVGIRIKKSYETIECL